MGRCNLKGASSWRRISKLPEERRIRENVVSDAFSSVSLSSDVLYVTKRTAAVHCLHIYPFSFSDHSPLNSSVLVSNTVMQ